VTSDSLVDQVDLGSKGILAHQDSREHRGRLEIADFKGEKVYRVFLVRMDSQDFQEILADPGYPVEMLHRVFQGEKGLLGLMDHQEIEDDPENLESLDIPECRAYLAHVVTTGLVFLVRQAMKAGLGLMDDLGAMEDRVHQDLQDLPDNPEQWARWVSKVDQDLKAPLEFRGVPGNPGLRAPGEMMEETVYQDSLDVPVRRETRDLTARQEGMVAEDR
jgi:hypothetical protein